MLTKLESLASHSAEYHYQLASCHQADGERDKAIPALERAIDLDPGHTGALFQLGFANDLAGNDDDAMTYYERCLKLLRPGGLIAVDNTLWSGRVADPREKDADTEALRAFNAFVGKDERVDLCLVPIADGLTLLRKR